MSWALGVLLGCARWTAVLDAVGIVTLAVSGQESPRQAGSAGEVFPKSSIRWEAFLTWADQGPGNG